MSIHKITKSHLRKEAAITLPASKSISNRALIISALCDGSATIYNLSHARDTQLLTAALKNPAPLWDVKDAGTTMRFLTAFCVAKNVQKTLTGTSRMCERPIAVLVDALRSLGADIKYENQEGYPPLTILGFAQKEKGVEVRGDISSQFISALLMIAPILPMGMELTLTNKVSSMPYITMTLHIMKHYGIDYTWVENQITIKPQKYNLTEIEIEPDWSAASYWYSFVALSDGVTLLLKNVKQDSWQGDRIIENSMTSLGVSTIFTDRGALLSTTDHVGEFHFDFTPCPDLAQTVIVLCASKGIKATFQGLNSLRLKETDRIKALQNELLKLGAHLIDAGNNWQLVPSTNLPSHINVRTYGDHRMAMAFAPLCVLMDLTFDNATVVDKSYPGFWEQVTEVCKRD